MLGKLKRQGKKITPKPIRPPKNFCFNKRNHWGLVPGWRTLTPFEPRWGFSLCFLIKQAWLMIQFMAKLHLRTCWTLPLSPHSLLKRNVLFHHLWWILAHSWIKTVLNRNPEPLESGETKSQLSGLINSTEKCLSVCENLMRKADAS